MSRRSPVASPPTLVQLVDDRATTIRQIVETVAIVAAGFWAFYVFVYQEDVKPAADPAALVVNAGIRRLGRDALRDVVLATMTFQNAGKTEIDVAADGIDVWGVRYADRPARRRSFAPGEETVANEIPERSRTLVFAMMELRGAAAGGPDRHIVLEPGSSIALTETIVVPRGAYDLLEASVVAAPIKTLERRKMTVAIERRDDGGLWLRGSGAPATARLPRAGIRAGAANDQRAKFPCSFRDGRETCCSNRNSRLPR